MKNGTYHGLAYHGMLNCERAVIRPTFYTHRGGQGGAASSDETLGRAFAVALGRKDFDEISAMLGPDIDFCGLTPGRAWEASNARAFVDEVLGRRFEKSDELEQVIAIEIDSFFCGSPACLLRFLGHNQDGPFVVEQQAYYTERDGRINWMRISARGSARGSSESEQHKSADFRTLTHSTARSSRPVGPR